MKNQSYLVFLKVGIIVMSGQVDAAFITTPWSVNETSLFTPQPSLNIRADSSVWTGNNLNLKYDTTVINNTIYPSASSYAGGPITVPTTLSSIVPLNSVGISFDFSHTGVFDYATVAFRYDNNPSVPIDLNQIGVRVSDTAYISTTDQNFLEWGAYVNSGGSPTINVTNNAGVAHVEFLFSHDLLTYMDLLIGIGFDASAHTMSAGTPVISGTSSYSNVSWLIDPGSSATYTRWHANSTPSVNQVPEPTTLSLVALAFFVFHGIKRRYIFK